MDGRDAQGSPLCTGQKELESWSSSLKMAWVKAWVPFP